MINEIPVRDHTPKKQPTPFSLGHLAILLGLVFVTLLILLLCSKGFDLIASKLWPDPKANTLSKVEISVDKSSQQKSNIEIPVSSTIPTPSPNQAMSNPAQTQIPFSEDSTALVSETNLPTPIPPAVSENHFVSPTSSGIERSKPAAVPSLAIIENKKDESKKEVQENKETAHPTKLEPITNVGLPGSHPSIEKVIQSNHFTVQIIAMHNPKKLRLFIDKNHLNKNVQVFQSEFQGKPWYVAVYGDFKTREEASKALSNLPLEVKAQKPWVRSMASLQDLHHVGQ